MPGTHPPQLTHLRGAFGPLMGAIIKSVQRERGGTKGEGKGVATLPTPTPGGPEAASTHGHNDWVDSDCDGDDDER